MKINKKRVLFIVGLISVLLGASVLAVFAWRASVVR